MEALLQLTEGDQIGRILGHSPADPQLSDGGVPSAALRAERLHRALLFAAESRMLGFENAGAAGILGLHGGRRGMAAGIIVSHSSFPNDDDRA